MNKKLCEKLKKAGFPQLPQKNFYEDGDDSITIPTLEQLTDDFVQRYDEFNLKLVVKDGLIMWEASGSVFSGDTLYKESITRERQSIAVAKLWLKLQKSQQKK